MSRFTPLATRWLPLLLLSLFAGWLLEAGHAPGAYLIGPLLVAVGFGASGIRLRLPSPCFIGAQALIGCAVAETVSAAIVLSIAEAWLPMALVVGLTVAAGAIVGWLLVHYRTLPGTTAAWGSAPGAASAMVAMAAEHGADMRLVALMQYLRMLVVVLTASSVSHLVWGIDPAAPIAPTAAAPTDWIPIATMLAVALGGAWLGQILRIPAGALVMTMLVGGALQAFDLAHLHQPVWIRNGAAIFLGWQVGLAFDRPSLFAALRLLPRLLLSTILLIVLCTGSAWLLVRLSGVDPLTAYLATTPGGLDTIVLIALGSPADTPFVVAVQTLRLFVVALSGPAIARLISRTA